MKISGASLSDDRVRNLLMATVTYALKSQLQNIGTVTITLNSGDPLKDIEFAKVLVMPEESTIYLVAAKGGGKDIVYVISRHENPIVCKHFEGEGSTNGHWQLFIFEGNLEQAEALFES